MMKKTISAFEISVEPVFVPGEGRAIEYLKTINMTVYATDIHEAMQKVQDLLRIDSSDYEIISACRSGCKQPLHGAF